MSATELSKLSMRRRNKLTYLRSIGDGASTELRFLGYVRASRRILAQLLAQLCPILTG